MGRVSAHVRNCITLPQHTGYNVQVGQADWGRYQQSPILHGADHQGYCGPAFQPGQSCANVLIRTMGDLH